MFCCLMFAESDSPACTFLCVTQTHRILLLLRRETGQRCLCTGRVDYRVQHAPDTPMKLAWCVVVASIYSTSVTGFGGTLRYCSRTSQTSPTQVRHKSLRSAGQDQIERGNGFEQSVDKGADVSNYKQTSGPVKAFVGGLTDVFVSFAGRGEDTDDSDASLAPKAGLSVEELEAGIRKEYDKNYLWTGDINEALYEEDCSFTDPTLSFSGLSTYKRNVGSLQGVLDKLVTNSQSVLYTCQLRQEDSCVCTRWRMVGDIKLPWGPTIDVVGRTTFSYDTDRGNRIYSYDEVWEVEPVEALMQLLKPGRAKNGPISPQ